MSVDQNASKPCPSCSSLMGPKGCLSCGWKAVRKQTKDEYFEPSESLELEGIQYTITKLQRCDQTCSRYLARDGTGAMVELLFARAHQTIDTRISNTERYPSFFAPLKCRTAFKNYQVAIFTLGEGENLIHRLTKARADRAVNDAEHLIKSIVLPVCELVSELQEVGQSLGIHDPSEIWITADNSLRLMDCPLIDSGQMTALNRTVPAFSPPEAYGRCGGRLDESADVFFIGMLLFHCLARVPVPSTVGLVQGRLPPPLLFHPRIPPELNAITRKSTSLIRTIRYSCATELSHAIRWALRTQRRRNDATATDVRLEIASETHIGLIKQRYCGENQDSHFHSWDPSTQRGIFLVSDGVSVSEFGSGDQASKIVADAAEALWNSLSNEVLFSTDETLGALDSTVDVSTEFSMSPLPIGTVARNRLLADMLDAANATIGATVHELLPASMMHPEGIMAATAVCCIIEKNRLTYCSIGDSKIYLVRDHHLTALNAEHNYASRLIGMGKDYNSSENAPNAAALVRCVGEFEFDERRGLIPVPLKPDFGEIQLLPGDTLILCSDGIPDYMASSEEQSEQAILELIYRAPSAAHLAYELVVAANRGGGGDNLTCTVIKVSQE